MEDELISFKTAKLAKEKGFNLECNKCWRIINSIKDKNKRSSLGDFYETNGGSPIGVKVFERFYAPTQSLLQRWLREVHNLNIEMVAHTSHIDAFEKQFRWVSYLGWRKDSDEQISSSKTYEGALEIALQEALKLIKNNCDEV
ncbi:hypothetical protein Phi4:1_gp033 [Cellulophaga phage phi4:1]|uniref:Uncharacterized protein n=3 Tax=Lightbulbvirus Cba41 TaxID=1918524 RepID=A0A0S2MWE2_9CAUD|nr:hypothetical protein Phi4:1_gp033 [Cellulophaga phage phi4:1]AGO49446.1 hypothetical protein Phi4:1_gp033 [Cellulophaga phage phi4:1]ALO80042.1 hypothetical protein Phi4113_033 [Cellulophaga phage phi4:1_13]ALO80239.1 hypothetical protein Phi4118_033 [Cellulophaga phage phi4:1_18]